jgi:hypothetical protein
MITPQTFYEFGAESVETDRVSASVRPTITPSSFSVPTLVWDTETAGLSKPGVCQLAYVLYRNGVCTEYNKILRLPDGVNMSKEAVNIHKITYEASAAGADPKIELMAFLELVDDVQMEGGVVAGHNVCQFDCRAINFTLQQLGLDQQISPTNMLDTMTLSKTHSPLTTVNGRKKNFKLSELYEHLYGEHPTWARLHNALDDVRVNVLCLLGGRRNGWW